MSSKYFQKPEGKENTRYYPHNSIFLGKWRL
jgi:hypothetical protein